MRAKNIEMMVKIIELEKTIQIQKENSGLEIQKIYTDKDNVIKKLSFEIDKQKAINNKHTKVYNEIIKDNISLQKNIEIKDSEILEINERLNRFIKLYQEIKEREDSILSVLEDKDKEILKLTENLKNKYILTVENLETFKFDSTNNSKNNEKYQMELLQKIKVLDINMKKYKFFEEIDEKIKEILKKLNIEGFVSLSKELIYNIGNRKVTILIKNNTIFVRAGGILKTLESFIYHNCNQDLEIFLKKKNKKNPKLTHKRSSTFNEIDKLGASIINKTFDARIKSEKGGVNSTRSMASFKRCSFSPSARLFHNKV